LTPTLPRLDCTRIVAEGEGTATGRVEDSRATLGVPPVPAPTTTTEIEGTVLMHERETVDGASPRTAPVLGLLVPAEPGLPVRLVLVEASSVAFSDAIGGGLLDDALTGACEGGRYGVYLDLDREAKDLPANDRATVLLVRLGRADRAVLAGLRGDALLVGVDVRGGDCDLPAGVLVDACRAGQRITVGDCLDTGTHAS
jgi:hypothetical protein